MQTFVESLAFAKDKMQHEKQEAELKS
jgi:hypothetical protein